MNDHNQTEGNDTMDTEYELIEARQLEDDDVIVNVGRIGAIARYGVFVVMAVSTAVCSIATGKIDNVQRDHVLHESDFVLIETR